MRHIRLTRERLGFTLVELLVASTILLIVMVILLQLTGTIGGIWRASTGKITAFQSARAAFETITRSVSQATLNTYFDYADTTGFYRTPGNLSSFQPAKFARASELHFLSGQAASMVPSGSVDLNPGSAIFFQAPIGRTNDTTLQPLHRTLNNIGFYVQYRSAADSGLLPPWLQSSFGPRKQFQLLQFIEPTENNKIYVSTSTADGNGRAKYDRAWFNKFRGIQSSDPADPRPAVLAENVLLFLLLPRLSPNDEKELAQELSGVPYNDSLNGSVLSPQFHYDSRAWTTNYTGGVIGASRREYMRNQLPPIVDVLMVVADPQSLARYDMTAASPPPDPTLSAGLFSESKNLRNDTSQFENQLSSKNIRFRTFKMSVPIRGAKWSNSQF